MIDNPKRIVAYYEGGSHCIPCAEAKFGGALYRIPEPIDQDGHKVITSTWPHNLGDACETCHKDIIRG